MHVQLDHSYLFKRHVELQAFHIIKISVGHVRTIIIIIQNFIDISIPNKILKIYTKLYNYRQVLNQRTIQIDHRHQAAVIENFLQKKLRSSKV